MGEETNKAPAFAPGGKARARKRRTGRKPTSRGRLWAFRLIALVVVPVVFFVLLEVGLRIGGYGYTTDYFIKADGRDEYITNPKFGWRFFPPAIARQPPVLSITREKAPGSYRIFVLGASAALGHPDPAYNIGRQLQVMLEEAFPGTQFEVITTAMTAINSHTVRVIADECAEFDPDLFVVYLGNNEVVGPFGPGTVFAGFSSSRPMIRASLWAKSLRTGQLIGNVAGLFASEPEETETWQGLEMFVDNPVARDDPRMADVYAHFRANLEDICAAADDAESATVLCTVGVNLGDCSPFFSMHRDDLTEAERAEQSALLEEATALPRPQEDLATGELVHRAVEIDPLDAELHYLAAQLLERGGDTKTAETYYRLARDQDALRFRADSKINGTIREVAAEHAGPRMRLADCEAALAAHRLAPGGIPGGDLFYEHVHLTFPGNHAVACAVFEQVVESLPPTIRKNRETASVPADQETCAARLGYSDWDELQHLSNILAMHDRAPFTYQVDTILRVERLEGEMEALREAATESGLNDARERYRAALVQQPEDAVLLRKLAQLEIRLGALEDAMAHAGAVLKRIPEDPTAHLLLGMALAKLGQPRKALEHYDESLRLYPDHAPAFMQAALAHMALGQLGEAEQACRAALKREPRFIGARHNLASILTSSGRPDEAIEQYTLILDQDSARVDIRLMLAGLLQRTGRADVAIEHYELLLAQDPNQPVVHNNYGNALRRLGRLDDAIAEYRIAVRLMPEFATAHLSLGTALLAAGERDEAIALIQEALRLDPQLQNARKTLDEAIRQRDAAGGQ